MKFYLLLLQFLRVCFVGRKPTFGSSRMIPTSLRSVYMDALLQPDRLAKEGMVFNQSYGVPQFVFHRAILL